MSGLVAWLFKAPDAETACSRTGDVSDNDSNRFMNVEGYELLEAVEDFVAGTLALKEERDEYVLGTQRLTQKVLRNLHCVDELLRDCELESQMADQLHQLRDSIKLKQRQEDIEESQEEVIEMDEELTAAKDACTESIKMLHKLLVALHEPLHEPKPVKAVDGTLHPADFNVEFSDTEKESMKMGLVDRVFQPPNGSPIEPLPYVEGSSLARLDVRDDFTWATEGFSDPPVPTATAGSPVL
jgi:hypothetical protein